MKLTFTTYIVLLVAGYITNFAAALPMIINRDPSFLLPGMIAGHLMMVVGMVGIARNAAKK